jgi:flagellar hook-associated protein 1 FlgK
MRSTFFGLETARRGMTTQQTALYVTGHNISNANTEGYTRQRVNFTTTDPYPPASMNRPQMAGQMGTGVQAGTIQRVREGFLDLQFRGESNKFNYYSTKADALEKMEEIMNEPSDQGLSKTLDRFWQALQDLSVNPQNTGARAVVRQRGVAVSETFNYLSNSLEQIKKDFTSQTEVGVKEVNSLLSQINELNKQISDVEPHGYLPNDLYDQRDNLIDKLSSFVNIKVTYQSAGGNSVSIAEGVAQIDLMDASGTTVIDNLVDATSKTFDEIAITDSDSDGNYDQFSIGGTINDLSALNTNGKLMSLIHSAGYQDNSASAGKGLYTDMIHKLDEMAFAFANSFNTVHAAGYSIADINSGTKSPQNFFSFGTAAPTAANTTGAAKALKLDQSIYDSLDNIAAATLVPPAINASIGDGSNALLLANVKSNQMTIDGNTTTIQSYYESAIGGMAVDAQEANRLAANYEVLMGSVNERRMSVSAVSLDEEMVNMVKFQHAYNAAARNITVVDEMLDKIINGLGTGGR